MKKASSTDEKADSMSPSGVLRSSSKVFLENPMAKVFDSNPSSTVEKLEQFLRCTRR